MALNSILLFLRLKEGPSSSPQGGNYNANELRFELFPLEIQAG
jgi:hypothetical protein